MEKMMLSFLGKWLFLEKKIKEFNSFGLKEV
jgi:hypothetical protein